MSFFFSLYIFSFIILFLNYQTTYTSLIFSSTLNVCSEREIITKTPTEDGYNYSRNLSYVAETMETIVIHSKKKTKSL